MANQEFQWAMIVVKHAIQPSTSTGRTLETTESTPNETAIFTADQFGTVQNNSLNSHKNGDDHGSCSEMYAVGVCLA